MKGFNKGGRTYSIELTFINRRRALIKVMLIRILGYERQTDRFKLDKFRYNMDTSKYGVTRKQSTYGEQTGTNKGTVKQRKVMMPKIQT